MENNLKKKLFLFTMNYPFSHGEHLLGFELEYLQNYFDDVTIVCNDVHSDQNYTVPQNVNVIRRKFPLSAGNKALSVLKVFSMDFWNEIFVVTRLYKRYPSLSIIKNILIFLKQSDKISSFIEQEIILSNPKANLFFYSWWTLPATFGFVKIKRRHPNVKTITRARAVDLYFERHSNNYLPLRKLIYSNIDCVLCISRNGKQYIQETNYVNTNNVVISRIGSINRYTIDPEVKQHKVKTIVSCSNLIPLKRINLIIESLALIKSYEIRWLHFGKGEYEQKLKQLAQRKLDPMPNIYFDFCGYIRNNELMKFYLSNYVDLFINVSEYEGVPVSIMEAMSFGIPAIATDVGGVCELVDNTNGRLLSKKVEPKEIARAITDYFSLDISKQNTYRLNAFSNWDKKYNADKNFNKLAKTISHL